MFQEFEENDKSEEFLSDFRNKINQQSISSFQEKKEEVARSKNILVGALSGIILAGVVGFIAFSPKYESSSQKELPVIRRPQTAVKVQPIEPGGMEIANKDKSIYDIIEKKVDEKKESVESILPPPEEIKAPVVEEAPKTVEVAETVVVENVAPVVAKKTEVATKQVAEKIELPKPVEVKQPKQEPEVKKVEAVVKKAPVAAKPAPAPKAQQTVSKGLWQVQIMSSQNKSAIEASKTNIAKKYAALKGVLLVIEDAQIAGKGTFYRLKAGAYKTKAEADKLCADLKKAGLSCFAKQK